MGCDIHLFAEIRKNGKWEQAGSMVKNEYYWPEEDTGNYLGNKKLVRERFYRGRNYQLFGVLAGVRSDGPPIVEQRGFPKDASKETKSYHKSWEGDAHSESWLNLKELLEWAYGGDFSKKSVNKFEKIDGYFAETTLSKLLKLATSPDVKPEDVRIVFWFDN